MKVDSLAMRFRFGGLLALSLGVLLSNGCGESPRPAAPKQQPASTVSAPPTISPPPTVAAPPATPAPRTATTPPNVERREAKAKERGYGPGVIATPIESLFAFRENAVFKIQIPDAMNKFKGIEGRAPKDNDEFMEKIIKANMIRLPKEMLQEGERFMYDPKTEKVMIEKRRPE
jgi:hypothetical protein